MVDLFALGLRLSNSEMICNRPSSLTRPFDAVETGTTEATERPSGTISCAAKTSLLTEGQVKPTRSDGLLDTAPHTGPFGDGRKESASGCAC